LALALLVSCGASEPQHHPMARWRLHQHHG
jgi:hypothetical protein